jgi:hypothetical protein
MAAAFLVQPPWLNALFHPSNPQNTDAESGNARLPS